MRREITLEELISKCWRRRRCRWIVVAVILLATFWPPVYWATPIKGRVVDADTGEPIEGVVVMARWVFWGGIFHGDELGTAALMEDVTDAEGRYSFRWWLPRYRPPLHYFLHNDPRLTFFKDGYRIMSRSNSVFISRKYGLIRHSQWHTKTITLQRFDGDINNYVEHLRYVRMRFVLDDCEWRKIPNMIREMNKVRRAARAAGRHVSIANISSLIPPRGNPDPCHARTFFAEQEQDADNTLSTQTLKTSRTGSVISSDFQINRSSDNHDR